MTLAALRQQIEPDFLQWSSGSPPDSEEQIATYVNAARPTDTDPDQVTSLLRIWMAECEGSKGTNEPTATKAREFTASDWYAFQGSSGWQSLGRQMGWEHQPLMREMANGIVVCGSEACEFFEGEDNDCFSWGVKFPTQTLARLFVDALPHDLTGKQAHAMGFTTL